MQCQNCKLTFTDTDILLETSILLLQAWCCWYRFTACAIRVCIINITCYVTNIWCYMKVLKSLGLGFERKSYLHHCVRQGRHRARHWALGHCVWHCETVSWPIRGQHATTPATVTVSLCDKAAASAVSRPSRGIKRQAAHEHFGVRTKGQRTKGHQAGFYRYML